MNNLDSSLKIRVMQRVRVIHMLRPVLSSTVLAALLFLVALWGVGQEVFVAHVFANMPPLVNVAAVTRFFVSAFVNTRFVVQAFSIVALGAFIWLVRDLVRTVVPSARFV